MLNALKRFSFVSYISNMAKLSLLRKHGEICYSKILVGDKCDKISISWWRRWWFDSFKRWCYRSTDRPAVQLTGGIYLYDHFLFVNMEFVVLVVVPAVVVGDHNKYYFVACPDISVVFCCCCFCQKKKTQPKLIVVDNVQRRSMSIKNLYSIGWGNWGGL